MVEESFSVGNSLMHRLDPRVKTFVAFLFSVMVAVSNSFPALLFSLFMAVVLVIFSRPPLLTLVKRLAVVNVLVFMIWVIIPFTHGGENFLDIGPLAVSREGLIYSARITIKSNAIVIALIALLSTMPVFTIGRAMRHLYVPSKIVTLFIFTYRYIHDIQREYQRLVSAIKIRGFNPGTDMHTYRTYAYLIGMLLVKSYDRAERVRSAMLCRGFKGVFYDLSEFSLKPADLVIMVIMLLAIIFIGLLQWTKTTF